MLFLAILLGCSVLGWLSLAVLSVWGAWGATVLRPGPSSTLLPHAPKVSIIVAARDEEEALPAALASLLNLDYPSYEVILVDDDSRDRTGLIADEWVTRPESGGKLKVIHNRELPSGWRGKVHALSLAAHAASGEWILATDADVIFHPAILRLGVSCALRKDARFVSLMPELELDSLAEKVVLPAFSFLLATLFPLRLVNDPGTPRAIAAGAFMLMRHDDFEALGGYTSLREAVIEDVGLAEMFKRNGRRIHVALTRGLFRTRMYRTWREIWEGLGRSAYEGTGFSLLGVAGGVIAGNALVVLPWVAACALAWRAASNGIPLFSNSTFVLAGLACLLSWLVYLPYLVFLRVHPIYVFTLPLACLFYSGVAVSSVWMSLLGRGVPWKGRHYRPPA